MKDTYSKVVALIITILIIVIIILSIFKSLELKEYSRNYFYMDTYINVKIYASNERKANKALDEIDNIYKEYHNLTNKYEEYNNGLYNLNKNNSKIDPKLDQMIRYGYDWYKKSNGLLNIALGNVTDIWKTYREKESGVPSIEELKKVNININDIKIGDEIKLKNNVTIDLGAISKGYTTEVVGNYLKSVGIKSYIINAGGNVLVGDYFKKGTYKIGIEDPTGQKAIYKIVKGNNIAVVTSGGYNRNYTYNGVTYNHIIDPNTLYPASNMLSVTVISKSSKEADALSTTLFLMDYKKGLEFIKNYDAEAIWYLKDGSIITTDGIKAYE